MLLFYRYRNSLLLAALLVLLVCVVISFGGGNDVPQAVSSEAKISISEARAAPSDSSSLSLRASLSPELPASNETELVASSATVDLVPAVESSAPISVQQDFGDQSQSGATLSAATDSTAGSSQADDLSDPDALYDFAEEVVDTAFAGGVGVRNEREDDEELALKIESSDLRPGVVGTPYTDTVRISGGTAPFLFVASNLPADFSIDPVSGIISGTAKVASESNLIVAVSDTKRHSQRRSINLIIRTTPIFISSSNIGQATIGEPFLVRLIAQGGKPPYSWSTSSGVLPTGLSLSPDGTISGVAVEEFSGVVRVMVEDDDKGIDQADLPLSVRAVPTAAGEVSETEVNDSGTALPETSPTETDTTDIDTSDSNNPGPTDTAGGGGSTATSKLKLFVAAPSSGKVGLAWQIASGSTLSISRSTETYPAAPADGQLACDGNFQAQTNCVDAGLENGRTYFYSAFIVDSSGAVGEEPPLQALVTPTAVSLSGLADPFVDEVVEFRPLDPGGCFNCNRVNQVVVGPPQGRGETQGSFDVVALGAKVNSDSGISAPYGGSITVRFSNNIVVNGSGVDFSVFENPIRLAGTDIYFVEPAVVDVSADGVNFYRFPFDFVPHYDAAGELNLGNPLCYARGFAGIKPVYSYLGGPDPTNPNLSGGDQFDLSDIQAANLSWIQYVRLTSTGDSWLTDINGDLVRHSNDAPTFGASGKGNSGFDFDAIAAVNY